MLIVYTLRILYYQELSYQDNYTSYQDMILLIACP